MVLRIKLSVRLSANLANRPFGAGGCAAGMSVIDRDGHFSGVACLIGDNDLLLTVRRREGKAACFVERDRRAVYGNGINVLFVNGDRLRLAVGLPVLNAGNNGPNLVKRYTVRAEICYVQALVNKHCINNIFSVRLY